MIAGNLNGFGKARITVPPHRYAMSSRWKEDIDRWYLMQVDSEYAGFLDFFKNIGRGAVELVRDIFAPPPTGRVQAPRPTGRAPSPSRSQAAEYYAGKLPVLRRGSRGPAVVFLQQALSRALGIPIRVDGIFGPQTEKAVRAFQRRMYLTVDGIVGPRTWKALIEQTGMVPTFLAIPRRPKPAEKPKPVPEKPEPAPAAGPEVPTAPKTGVLDFLMKNWLWLALGGATLVTLVILMRQRQAEVA